MKKSLLVLPLIVVSLAGCNSSSVSSITSSSEYGDLLSIAVTSGLATEYELNAIVDLDAVSVTASFANDDLVVLGTDLTFDPAIMDTTTVGEFDLTITYLTESVVWTYTVVEYFEIDNISTPDFVTTYNANIAIKDEANKRSEFMDLAQGYAVGDDNAFRFFPNIYAYNSDDEVIEVTSYHSQSLVQLKNGVSWLTLTGADLDEMVAIDEFASTYDFTAAAIGETFKLTVRPFGDQYATNPKFSTSFEFNVVNGFNVYTQDDLAQYNNYNVAWDTYRTANGLTAVEIEGIVFQNDIEIVRAKIPDAFFYMEGDADVLPGDADIARVYGSLRDVVDIYQRNILPGEDFTFNGNYFNLDYSTLPVVVRDYGRIDAEAGMVVSHAALLKVGITQIVENCGDFTLKNLSVVGNANRTEEPEKSGGAIFHKITSVNGTVYNTIATQCFTIYLTELTAPTVLIDKSRGYDSFSSLLFNWGTNDFLIRNSEFIGAGGPAIISDHVGPLPDGTGGNQPHTKLENTILESFVSGNENWFRLVGATATIPGIIGIGEGLLPNYGTNTITKMININGIDVPHFNLVSLIKNGGVNAPTSDKINGTFQIDETVELDFSNEFMTQTAMFPAAMPRFQSTGGQTALFDGEKLVDGTNTPIIPFAYTSTNYFTGDFMNLYLNIGTGDGFMGLTFGLIDRAT